MLIAVIAWFTATLLLVLSVLPAAAEVTPQDVETAREQLRRVSARLEGQLAEYEAMVVEEDTCLVLSTPVDLFVTPEHPVRVMTEVHAASPLVPGSVVVRPGSPLRFLAVVHDLDQEPSCREAWVVSALDEVIEKAEARGLRAIGLPMIGTLHGDLSPERFVVLLRDALQRSAPTSLRRIWLIFDQR